MQNLGVNVTLNPRSMTLNFTPNKVDTPRRLPMPTMLRGFSLVVTRVQRPLLSPHDAGQISGAPRNGSYMFRSAVTCMRSPSAATGHNVDGSAAAPRHAHTRICFALALTSTRECAAAFLPALRKPRGPAHHAEQSEGNAVKSRGAVWVRRTDSGRSGPQKRANEL